MINTSSLLTGPFSGALGIKDRTGVIGVEQRLQEGYRHGSSQRGETLTQSWQLSAERNAMNAGTFTLTPRSDTVLPLYIDVFPRAQRVQTGQDSIAGHLDIFH